MKTSDLVTLLAADAAPVAAPRRIVLLAAAIGGLAALVPFVWQIGVRPDLGHALSDPRVAFKFVFAATVGLAALASTLRASSPDRALVWSRALGPALLLLVAMTGAEALATPSSSWLAATIGTGPLGCLASILATACPPTLALLWALRSGATRHPAATGAAAGLAGGAIGAGIFALHCPNDSSFFVALWYGLGLALTAAWAGLAGRRILRW